MQIVFVLVMVAAWGALYVYQRSRRKEVLAEHADKTLAALAQRLGMGVDEGEPNQNLLTFTEPGGDYQRRLRASGAPYGRRASFAVMDGVETGEYVVYRNVTRSFSCVVDAQVAATVPPFEVVMRDPQEFLVPLQTMAQRPDLRLVSTGNPALDARFAIRAADPRMGPALVPALEILARLAYVHVTGEGDRVWMSFTRWGFPSLLFAPEEYQLALETAACAIEGKPAPARLAAPVVAQAPQTFPASSPLPEAPATGEAPAAVPAPCLQCGAPMALVAPVALHADPTLCCTYCGLVESMPAEAAAQHRHLQLRIMQVRQARDAVEAPLKTLEAIRKSWVFALPFFAAMGGRQIWNAMTPGTSIADQVAWLVFAAAVLGVPVGYVGMIRTYRGVVAPLLQARPPLAQGLAARCRSCGGMLGPVRAPQAQCGYCGATNLLDAGLARAASDLLAAERAEYERRAHRVSPPDGSAFRAPTRAFFRWAIAGALGVFVLTLPIALLVSRTTRPHRHDRRRSERVLHQVDIVARTGDLRRLRV